MRSRRRGDSLESWFNVEGSESELGLDSDPEGVTADHKLKDESEWRRKLRCMAKRERIELAGTVVGKGRDKGGVRIGGSVSEGVRGVAISGNRNVAVIDVQVGKRPKYRLV